MQHKYKTIAIAGSAANPVTWAHREFAEALTHSGLFDLVLWFPSGLRSDKKDLVDARHRVHMTELLFDGSWRKRQPTEFRIDLREANRVSIPTIELLSELAQEYPGAAIMFATGVDVLVPQDAYDGKCEVAYRWVRGEELLRDRTFVVLARPGYPDPDDLRRDGMIPKHSIILPRRDTHAEAISSTEVRRRLSVGESIRDLVPPEVEAYIRREHLYERATLGKRP